MPLVPVPKSTKSSWRHGAERAFRLLVPFHTKKWLFGEAEMERVTWVKLGLKSRS